MMEYLLQQESISDTASSPALSTLGELSVMQRRLDTHQTKEKNGIERDTVRERSRIELEKSKIELTVERALTRQKL